MLDERTLVQFRHGFAQFALGIHDDRSVPRDGLSKRSARDQQKSDTIGARVSPGSGALGQVMLGALLIIVLQLIPVINVVMVLFVLLALGSAVLTGLGSAPDWFDRHATLPASRA